AAKWKINSPDLGDFMPDLSGELIASGDLAGRPTALRLQAEISGNNIAYTDIAIRRLQANANIDLSGQNNGTLSLSADNIQLSGQPLNSLTLNINGARDRHQLQAELKSALLNLQIAADGRLNELDKWQGEFSEFTFETPDAGRWQLSDKALINISADAQTLPQHCWQAAQGNICLQAVNSTENGWQAAGEFAAIPIGLLESFYQDVAKLSGQLQGQFSLAADPAQNYTGSGQIALQQGKVQLIGEGFRQATPVGINALNLQYQLDAQNSALALTLAPDIAGVSPVDARLQTLPLKDFLLAPDTSQMSLQVQTAIEDLSQLNLTHPAIEDLKGVFNADIDITGTLKKPQINSMLSLRDAQVVLIEQGITLDKLNADISGDPQSGINFVLQGASADGPFEIDGEFLLPDNGWQLAAAIKGDKVLLMNLPEAYVIASPDLQLKMTAETAKLRGKLTIPEARLEPTQFNMAVSPSQDVVVINEPQPEPSVLQTDIDIVVSLGDNVQISAAGFQGNLSGDLAVSGDAGELLLADGEITLDDGSYVAYGRKLTVNNGKIRFSGGAIDNPDLDVKAVRKLTDVTVGIHLTGPVDNPQATLFSTPSMSQDDILSYILIGRPLNEATSGDGAMLASAATSLGIQNGNALSDQIAGTFGLDTVSFVGESPETAVVQIGKYLSPRLYIGYGIGVLEPVSTVQLRYELSKIWTLQAESGTESGVDLLYIYER
ncbi:MAG: translocation/assembly module TamB domain-containing protein, partial [Methylophaga sp.]|nr:translocation/assembly module TamB domain-containing protein [Methylophaga sp.]